MDELGEQNIDVKRKQSQLIGKDSVTDICKYHFLCFCDHNTGQGHLRSPGKRGKKKNRDLELRYMFLSQMLAKNAKMTLKYFLKRQNRSKNKVRKITVKSRNDVKSARF